MQAQTRGPALGGVLLLIKAAGNHVQMHVSVCTTAAKFAAEFSAFSAHTHILQATALRQA